MTGRPLTILFAAAAAVCVAAVTAHAQQEALFGTQPYGPEYEAYPGAYPEDVEPMPDPAAVRREVARRNYLRYAERMRAYSPAAPIYGGRYPSYGRARQMEQRWLYENGLRSDRDFYDKGAFYERDVSGYFGRSYTYPSYNPGYGGFGGGYGGLGGGYGGVGTGYGGYGSGYGGLGVQGPDVYYGFDPGQVYYGGYLYLGN